jgi:hypothetical protein
MIKTKDLDSKPAGRYAWAASRDAEKYSDECRMLYTARQRSQIETFLSLVQLAYTSVRAEPTYRKNFAVVKVENGVVRDRKMAREIDEICTERGYEKTRSTQALSFRIRFV